jgi:hypothetical protein
MSRPSGSHSPKRSSNDSTNLPLIRTGYAIVVLSVLFFLIGGYATFFSVFISPPPNFVRDRVNIPPVSTHLTVGKVLEVMVEDTHYKYLVLFLIPTFSYFAIANWVGWQYYQNT